VYVLRIDHPVPDYDDWKKAFDSDPIGREKSGVKRHGVMRSVDNPNLVLIDLEFDSLAPAQAMHEALKGLWSRVQGEGLIGGPQARIVEVCESRDY